MPMRWIVAVVSIALVALGEAPAIGQTPKPGGMLTLRLREDLPQGFSINESPTISTMWPAMLCFSNLVLFDPAKPTHSADTIIGELAERWAWEENYRKLVLALRGNVTWHDGRPFSATDVKYTLDAGGARCAGEAADQSPARVVRQRRPRRGGRSAHGGHPSQAPATVVPAHARLRLHADLRRSRAGGELPHRLHRHRAVQGQGVAQGRVRRVRQEPELL